MDSIRLSVRELVEFNYQSGDLETNKHSMNRALEGILAHKTLQESMGDNYKKEFYLKREFYLEQTIFIVDGRADGILIEDGKVIVDEIKSTYTNLDFIDSNYYKAHIAQAKCYGYLYSLEQNLKFIDIQIRYYNINSKEVKTIKYYFTFSELEVFFNDLLNEYYRWFKTLLKLRNQRDESIEQMQFPFERYRKNQRQFSLAVYQTIKEKKKLFAQAPTGVGKTISVLFPTIKSIQNKEYKIYYLTAKSSTKSIAFNTLELLHKKGLKIRAIVITAKEKICFKEETRCEKEYCEFARGYYDKINAPLRNAITNDFLFSKQYIESLAREYEICPFELSLNLSLFCDITICDYNYYFDPRVALIQEETAIKNKILLIDEAHNLEDRARGMYSPEIIKDEYYNLYKTMKNIDNKLSKALYNINKKFIEIKDSSSKNMMILKEDPKNLISSLRNFIDLADKYINENKADIVPDELKDLYFKSLFFVNISEIKSKDFCYYIESENRSFKVKLFLINPSNILKQKVEASVASIFFSATLTPLKYYRYILGGNEDDYILKIKSPFKEENLKLIISSNLNMKYELRDLNIIYVAKYINALINSKPGNYMVFSPSYSFMYKLYEEYKNLYPIDNVVIHNSGIDENEQIEIIEKFNNKRDVLLFTVVGSYFSEGIDLTLDKLIGAVIIGTGIPQLSFERDIIKDFFDNSFYMGYDFAYKYPGFNKILQSAGRVIRTEQDKGVILLIDSRLCENTYFRLFPEHWSKNIKIGNQCDLINELYKFWEEK